MLTFLTLLLVFLKYFELLLVRSLSSDLFLSLRWCLDLFR